MLSTRAAARRLKRSARTVALLLLAPFAPLSRARQGRRPVVLAYHDPSPEVLGRHLAALGRRHSLVTLEACLAALASGDLSALPPKPLAVTLDDGRVANLRLVETLRAHALRPTVFACTAVADRFWWSGLDPLLQRHLKQVPDEERRRVVSETRTTDARQVSRESLTDAGLVELAAHADIQPHSRTHPALPRCDEATARDEIAGARADLEALLGGRRDVFAYPHGAFTDRERDLLREAGYRFAFGTQPGLCSPSSDRLALPRVVVRDDAPAWEAVVRASRLPGIASAFIPRRLHSALQVR